MIISPPFLPERSDDQDDAAWVASAMQAPADGAPGLAGFLEGRFPWRGPRMWADGIDLQAPRAGDGSDLPVCAIADGIVLYAEAGKQPDAHPGPAPAGSAHPMACTDTGVVIIAHETDIGSAGHTATERPTGITYYSVSMHLDVVAHNRRTQAPWRAGDRVYRKELLGTPGRVDGRAGRIHFAICCDEANAEAILGHAPDCNDNETCAPSADGRTDSVFGDIHIYLPATTPTHPGADPPASHLRAACGSTLGEAQWVSIRYDKGMAWLRSHDAMGGPIGAEIAEPDVEYDLYQEATERHGSLGANMQDSSPSGWYELLRFGRNLGPDPLPSHAAHWRRIPAPGGPLWADLHAPGSFKFSDADFLRVRFAAHGRSAGDPDLPAASVAAAWHFHPTGFITCMRRCAWFSASELAQCIPRHAASGTTPWASALERGQAHCEPMSRMFRKYNVCTPERKIHFLAQIFIETGLLRTVQETGRGAPNARLPKAQSYAAFHGRGYMQLTWPCNYAAYGAYRALQPTATYADARISSTSRHVWSDFDADTEQPTRKPWFPRYDPDLLVTDAHASADSGGYYWVSKTFRGTSNIHRVADLGVAPRHVGCISWLVNGGSFGYVERQQFARYLANVLGDAPRRSGGEAWKLPPFCKELRSFPPKEACLTQEVQIDHTPQVP